jgi:hypothetical protein
MVEAVSAAGRTGQCRHAARAGEIRPQEGRILAVRRTCVPEVGETTLAQSLFWCAPAKRIRISRLEHVFDL